MPKIVKPVEQSKEPAALTPKKMNAPSRLFRWIDQRTGVHEVLKESLDEPIPGGARLAYVFASGLLYIFISQIITGLCLTLYYVPSADCAHTSVAYIMKQVAAGSFLRSLMVGLSALAYLHPAQLGPVANPANTEFIARPDWLYLPFFEWLKFFEGPTVVLAVVVVPGLLALAFFLMPFLDHSLERKPCGAQFPYFRWPS